MSVLSGIRDGANALVVEPEEQVLEEVLESTRLVFMNMSEAMNDHLENTEYFRVRRLYIYMSRLLTGLTGCRWL